MKLQAKWPQKGDKNREPLIMYFDMCWLTYAEILRTPEGIASGLCQSGLASRLKCKKNDTLEKVLRPKNKHIKPVEPPKETIKIRGTFSIPEVFGQFLIKKEIRIDAEKYNKSSDKDLFIKQSFIHAISDRIEVRCEKV